jgi:methionyl-tRNA formyltransferase
MIKKKCMSLLFLGKKNDEHCTKALQFIQENFENVASYLGEWNEPLPDEIINWSGDYIVSYLSRWIIPAYVINKAKIGAINFHPAPPQYPGIGCINFALYDEVSQYGVTCHHMAPEVDTGQIIDVKYFPIFPGDSVASLLSRTYDFQLVLFYEILGCILQDKALPASSTSWTRPPFTRKEFNQLGKIKLDMSPEEISRRVRAVSYGIYQPTIEVADFQFILKPSGN